MKTIVQIGLIIMCFLLFVSCNVNVEKGTKNDDKVGKCFVAEVNGNSKMCFRIIGNTNVEVYRSSPFDIPQEKLDGYESIEYFGNAIIPETIKYDGEVYKVTKIGDYAFFCSKITSIVIPKSVISIGESSFQACNKLKKVIIPKNVKCIGQYAFTGCTSIISIEMHEGVINIGEFAFKYCEKLRSIVIPSSVLSLKEGVFHGCFNLNSVMIKEGVKSIEDSAFEECTSLTHITIPRSVTKIGEDAFARCSMLTCVNIQNPELNICFEDVFSDCDKLIQDSVVYR